MRSVYLDYNATTPMDPRVFEAMAPYFTERFGNASSIHAFGYDAHAAIEAARDQVAALIAASSDEIVFTGGGSESDNLAIKGVVFAQGASTAHVVATAVDHPAVLRTLQYLESRFGTAYTLLPVDEYGSVSPTDLRTAIRPSTALVTVIHANNEVGTIQDVQALAEIAHEHGALFHTDAAQSAGKIPIDVGGLGVDLLTIAAHKLYGPKGIGALFVRRGVTLDPLVHGGTQEHGLRAGTENVPSCVGLGEAARLARDTLPEEGPTVTALRDMLYQLLVQEVPGTLLNGHPSRRVPNTLNVSLPGALGVAVLGETPEVAASTGSACHGASPAPSGVLVAMGLPPDRIMGAMRLTLGRWTTPEDIHRAATALAAGYKRATMGLPASPVTG